MGAVKSLYMEYEEQYRAKKAQTKTNDSSDSDSVIQQSQQSFDQEQFEKDFNAWLDAVEAQQIGDSLYD